MKKAVLLGLAVAALLLALAYVVSPHSSVERPDAGDPALCDVCK